MQYSNNRQERSKPMNRKEIPTNAGGRVLRAVYITLTAALMSTFSQVGYAQGNPTRHAVWVWPKVETHPNNFDWEDAIARQALIDNAANSGVNTIYLSTFLGDPVDPGNNPSPKPGHTLISILDATEEEKTREARKKEERNEKARAVDDALTEPPGDSP